MPYTQSWEDYLRDVLKPKTQVPSWDEYLRSELAPEKPKTPIEEPKPQSVWGEAWEGFKAGGNVLGQMAYGAANTAGMGFPKEIAKLAGSPIPEPEGVVQEIGYQAGSLFGFLVGGPLKLAKLGIVGVKSLASRALGREIMSGGAAKLASHMIEGSLTLGAAQVLSDVPEMAKHPKATAPTFGAGAVMGGAYGLAGLAHIAAHPVASQLIRQVGGRALMELATGEKSVLFHPLETPTRENLPRVIYKELLDTFFFSKGVDPGQAFRTDMTEARAYRALKKMGTVSQENIKKAGGALPLWQEMARTGKSMDDALKVPMVEPPKVQVPPPGLTKAIRGADGKIVIATNKDALHTDIISRMQEEAATVSAAPEAVVGGEPQPQATEAAKRGLESGFPKIVGLDNVNDGHLQGLMFLKSRYPLFFSTISEVRFVKEMPSGHAGKRAFFDPDSNAVYVNVTRVSGSSPKDVAGILAHETRHGLSYQKLGPKAMREARAERSRQAVAGIPYGQRRLEPEANRAMELARGRFEKQAAGITMDEVNAQLKQLGIESPKFDLDTSNLEAGYVDKTGKWLTREEAGVVIQNGWVTDEVVLQKTPESVALYKTEAEELLRMSDQVERTFTKKLKPFYDNPIYFLSHIPVIKKLYYDMRTAGKRAGVVRQSTRAMWAEIESTKIHGDAFHGADSYKRIFAWLTSKQENGAAVLEKSGWKGGVPNLNKSELAAVNTIRATLDSVYEAYNAARVRSGLKPMNYKPDYIPWITKINELSASGENPVFLPSVEKMQAEISLREFKFATPRSGATPEVFMNAKEVLDTYINSSMNHIFKSEAIAKANLMLEKIPVSMKHGELAVITKAEREKLLADEKRVTAPMMVHWGKTPGRDRIDPNINFGGGKPVSPGEQRRVSEAQKLGYHENVSYYYAHDPSKPKNMDMRGFGELYIVNVPSNVMDQRSPEYATLRAAAAADVAKNTEARAMGYDMEGLILARTHQLAKEGGYAGIKLSAEDGYIMFHAQEPVLHMGPEKAQGLVDILHNPDQGGFTYSVKEGRDLAGERAWAVSVGRDTEWTAKHLNAHRTSVQKASFVRGKNPLATAYLQEMKKSGRLKTFTSRESQAAFQDIMDFVYIHADELRQGGRALGGYMNPGDASMNMAGRWELNVTGITPYLEKAKRIATHGGNEKAWQDTVWYLHKGDRKALGSTQLIKVKDIDMEMALHPDVTQFSLADRAPNVANGVRSWLEHQAGRTPKTHMPLIMNKVFTSLNRRLGGSILAGLFRTAAIQPWAIKNLQNLVGTKYTVQGILESAKPANRALWLAESEHLLVREMDVHTLQDLQRAEIQPVLDITKKLLAKTGSAGLRWYHKQRATATEIGYIPMKELDFVAAEVAYGSGRAMGRAKGLRGKELVRFADDVVIKTQASAAPEDVARLQYTPGGKLLSIFNTFIINEWNLISRDLMGIGEKMTTRDRQKFIGRVVLTGAMVNALFEGAFHMNSPFPAPEWAAFKAYQEDQDKYSSLTLQRRSKAHSIGRAITAGGAEFATAMPVIGTTIRYSTPKKIMLPAGARVVADAVQAAAKLAYSLDVKSLNIRDLQTIGELLGLPGTFQAARFVNGIKKGLNPTEALMNSDPATYGTYDQTEAAKQQRQWDKSMGLPSLQKKETWRQYK